MNTLKSWQRSVFLLMILMLTMNGNMTAQTLEAKFDEYMSGMTRLGRFNGYVMVAREGRLVFSKGYGMANFEDEVPNTVKTKFRLASITKTFTATAVLMLQEKGKLGLQDSVCKHLSNCPPAWKPVTIEHLLSHTSGIPDYAQLPDFMSTLGQSSTTAEMIARFSAKPLQFTPGERFAYSNSNYYLLGQIIERVAGEPYADFVRENIFAPLGMVNSGYEDNRAVLKSRAAGYIKQGETLINARYMDMSKAYAAGGLYSTAEDLLLWDAALYTERLVSKKSLAMMFTPGKGEVGYGWFVKRDFNRQLITQAGLNSGFAAVILRYPEERACIILLSNFESAAPYLQRAGRDLSAILFGEQVELQREAVVAKVDAKIYDDYVGEYEFGPNRLITVTREGDKLYAQRAGAPRAEILPENETTFFMTIADVRLTFVKDEAGKVTGMVLRANGQEFKGRKTK
jgi:CubicO group peptidase (beta-lactamase class C family)